MASSTPKKTLAAAAAGLVSLTGPMRALGAAMGQGANLQPLRSRTRAFFRPSELSTGGNPPHFEIDYVKPVSQPRLKSKLRHFETSYEASRSKPRRKSKLRPFNPLW